MNENINSDDNIVVEIPSEENHLERAFDERENIGKKGGINIYLSEGDDAILLNSDEPVKSEESSSAEENLPKAKGRAKRRSQSIEDKIKSLEMALKAETERNQTLYNQYLQKDSNQANLQRQIQELNEKLNASAQAQDKQIALNVKHEENIIKQSLLRAKNEGDYESELKYTEQLAELKAKKHAYEAYKYSIEDQNARYKNNEPYVPVVEPLLTPPPRQTSGNPHFDEWLQDNQWYASDPALREEADQVASELRKRLTLDNSAHLIGTYEFFDSVSEILRGNYNSSPKNVAQNYQQPTYEEDENDMEFDDPNNPIRYNPNGNQNNYGTQPNYNKPNRNYGVAPVSSTPSMASQYANSSQAQYKNKVVLTPEQRQMAHMLTNRHPTETSLEKEIRFARSLQNSQRRRPKTNDLIDSGPYTLRFD